MMGAASSVEAEQNLDSRCEGKQTLKQKTQKYAFVYCGFHSIGWTPNTTVFS